MRFKLSDAHKCLLASCTQVEASNCGIGTAGAKAFGDVLRDNKTIQHLNVSNNSFGRPVVGDQVKLKSNGKMCQVFVVNTDGRVALIVDGVQDTKYRADSEWELESQVPAFCAGLAASSSLLSVSDSMWCSGRLSRPCSGAGC